MNVRREELYWQISQLREVERLTWREIGERLGIPYKRANEIYHDRTGERENARKRRWDEKHRAICVRCWRRVAPRTHDKPNWRGHCVDCYRLIRRRAADERIADVAAMYNDGLSMREIAQQLGYGPRSVPSQVTEARRRGLIGYRNRGYGNAA